MINFSKVDGPQVVITGAQVGLITAALAKLVYWNSSFKTMWFAVGVFSTLNFATAVGLHKIDTDKEINKTDQFFACIVLPTSIWSYLILGVGCKAATSFICLASITHCVWAYLLKPGFDEHGFQEGMKHLLADIVYMLPSRPTTS